MVNYFSLSDFYRSKAWQDLRQLVIADRLKDGWTICEYCGKPIYKSYDIILHHKEELTLANVNDAMVSLNPDNLMIVHNKCHNEIHSRWGSYTRHIYLVWGSPLSGKSSWVKSVATKHDLVIDLDIIRCAITGGTMYERSNRVNDNVFNVQRCLLDNIKHKQGQWVNAYIIGSYPYIGERERLCKEYGAEEIYIDSTLDECLARLEADESRRDKKMWEGYIKSWFETAGPTSPRNL